MITPPPSDVEVRERAARDVQTSYALSASAGAGKTTVLVERLTHLLLSGTSARSIAAITFTEAAASELRIRVRDAFELRLAAASGEERASLERILRELPALTLSTIHAFCLELLRAESLEAGWAPGTEIHDAAISPVGVTRAYRAWRSGFDRRHPEVATTLRKAATEGAIRIAALEVLEHRDLEPIVGPKDVPWEDARRELSATTAALTAALACCTAPDRCILLRNNRGLIALLDRAGDTSDAGAAVRLVLQSGEGGSKVGGRAQDWPGGAKKRFTDCVDALRGWRARWAEALLGPVHRTLLLDLIEHFIPLARSQKTQSSEADFDDLLFRALELLESSPGARARLAARYAAILIDEVQDTDPIQSRIVLSLTREPKEKSPRPGALFAVGDPKQSIYRFRRADVATWLELEELISANGARDTLVENFRSVPGIVAFANHVFATLPHYTALAPHRPPGALDPVVVLPTDAEHETDAAIRHLLDLRRAGAQIVDRDTKALRPLEWRDVMVLLPSWTAAERTQDLLLRAGIDCVVEGGNAFFLRDEVRLSIHALRAIEEPGDSEAIVAALRGLFGLSHADLAGHVGRGGSWRYTLPEHPSGPVADALSTFRKLHVQRGRRSWAALLDDVLERTRASAVWSLMARGHAALANLDKLRALIRRFEAAARTPGEVVERLAELARVEKEQELPIGDPESNAVRITTLFKAKGLESPLVVLLHAHRWPGNTPAIVDRAEHRVAIRAGDLKPPGWDELFAREREEQSAEMRRWMYVAATRARDQLVIASTPDANLLDADLARGFASAAGAAHETLISLDPDTRVRVRRLESLEPPRYEASTFPGHDATVDALLAAPPEVGDPEGEERARAIKEAVRASAARSTRWRSVTELAGRARNQPGDGGGVGAEAGAVIHRVMEHLDLSRAPEELEPEISALAAAFGRMDGLREATIAKCGDIARRLIAHPIVAAARAAPERWQEVPFAFKEAKRIVSGTIDLCFPRDAERKRWVVVDWKSTLPPEGSERRARYERQIALYGKALLANLGGATGGGEIEVETVLVGPHPELEPERVEETLASVNADLRPGLEALLQAGAPAPTAGADAGEPVIATLELAWEAHKIGLLLDATDEQARALGADGWRIAREDTSVDGWAERAIAALAESLGVALPATPASSDSEDGDGDDGPEDAPR